MDELYCFCLQVGELTISVLTIAVYLTLFEIVDHLKDKMYLTKNTTETNLVYTSVQR